MISHKTSSIFYLRRVASSHYDLQYAQYDFAQTATKDYAKIREETVKLTTMEP